MISPKHFYKQDPGWKAAAGLQWLVWLWG